MISQYEKKLFIGLLVLFAAIGSVIGIFIYRHQSIAHGILGIAVLCFTINKNFLNTSGTIEKLLLQPSRMKVLFSVSVLSFLGFLSIMAVFKMLASFLF